MRKGIAQIGFHGIRNLVRFQQAESAIHFEVELDKGRRPGDPPNITEPKLSTATIRTGRRHCLK